MTADDDIRRPLWESLRLSDGEPYGGLFGPDGGGRRHYNAHCIACGAVVTDRGLHYRFHVQITQMFAILRDARDRQILSTITEADDPGMIEIYDSDGNIILSLPQKDPDEQ